MFSNSVEQVHQQLASTGGQTVLRRLNQREYINTLEDLFSRNLQSFDPTSKFPRDRTVEHMDNIGDALVTSGYLLDQYLEAADAVVEKALEPVQKPEVKSWQFKGNFYQGQELSYSHKKVFNYRYLCVYEVPNTVNHEGGYAAISEFEDGVHADGLYEIQVLAHSMHRDTSYDPSIFEMDFSEPFRLGIVPGDITAGTMHHPQPIEPQLAEVTVADGKPQWVHHERLVGKRTKSSLHFSQRHGELPEGVWKNRLSIQEDPGQRMIPTKAASSRLAASFCSMGRCPTFACTR